MNNSLFYFRCFASTSFVLLLILIQGCAIIRPGQAGVKQRLGKLSDVVHTHGAVFYNPFTTRVVRASIQTTNLELSLSLPSKEGLSITSQISILYKTDVKKIQDVIKNIGLSYENIIANVFRSAAADVCAQFFAKDMHSGMRAEIEKSISKKMAETLSMMFS